MKSEIPEPALLKEIELQAVDWAVECGRIATDRFRRGMAVEYKGRGGRDPVTEVDRSIEDFLRRAIGGRFAGHSVLGEEGPDTGSATADYVWVIDPVDGTANFASGLPIFAVSIGVLYRGRPAVGAIFTSHSISFQPAVIHARSGAGAFLDHERAAVSDERSLQASQAAALPAGFWRRFAFGPGLRGQPIEVRTLGSIACEMALIASGALRFGIYRAPKIWDVAAAAVIVAEAGGVVLQWERTRKAWHPLQRFSVPAGDKGRPARLRDWSMPLVVGANPIATYVAQNLRPREGFRARIWPLIWRLLGG